MSHWGLSAAPSINTLPDLNVSGEAEQETATAESCLWKVEEEREVWLLRGLCRLCSF